MAALVFWFSGSVLPQLESLITLRRSLRHLPAQSRLTPAPRQPGSSGKNYSNQNFPGSIAELDAQYQ